MRALPFAFAREIPGLKAFTTLRGDNLGLNTDEAPARVIESRQGLFGSQGIALNSTVFMRQVHGQGMARVGSQERGRGSLDLADAIPDCDSILSADPGVFLCVGHADCLALLLVDPVKRAVGAAHCGWRGASLRLATQLLQRMETELGTRPADVYAGLSVCLGPCHLELSENEHRIFSPQPGSADFCSPLRDGHFFLDLWKQTERQLLDLGLAPEKIEVQDECTACHPERFYSFRREQGHCGRMLSVIGFDR
ncbi:MAG: polyphenol oxidase family protein [candidate division FCPU426 bacterium]